MVDLLTAIGAAFDTLNEVFPNGVFINEARDGDSLPLAVGTVVSVVPDYSTQDEYGNYPYVETANIQFDVWVATEVATDTDVWEVMERIEAIYGNTKLETDGDSFIAGRRISGPMVKKEDPQTWRGMAEYVFKVQR